jgi:hypothetical protein
MELELSRLHFTGSSVTTSVAALSFSPWSRSVAHRESRSRSGDIFDSPSSPADAKGIWCAGS